MPMQGFVRGNSSVVDALPEKWVGLFWRSSSVGEEGRRMGKKGGVGDWKRERNGLLRIDLTDRILAGSSRGLRGLVGGLDGQKSRKEIGDMLALWSLFSLSLFSISLEIQGVRTTTHL